MDITHISASGCLKYVPVIIDTYFGFLIASTRTGESAKHSIQHCLRAFAIVGVPQILKTDNVPVYTSITFQKFGTTF